jgi:hypothetical protein
MPIVAEVVDVHEVDLFASAEVEELRLALVLDARVALELGLDEIGIAERQARSETHAGGSPTNPYAAWMTWCNSPRSNVRGTIRRRQIGGSISWSVTRIWTAVGTLNTSLQYALLLPGGFSPLDTRRGCRPNVPVDGLTDSLLKHGTAID